MVPLRASVVGPILAPIALGLLVIAGKPWAAEGIAAGDLDRWLSHQTHLTTWSAEVIQTRRLMSLAEPLVTPGRVWFKAPNLFRWELGVPAQTIALREPDRLVLLYPQLRRAEVYPLTGDGDGPWRGSLTLLEAGFPQHRGQLEQQFQVLSAESQGSNTLVRLQPKSKTARRWVTAITVTVNSENLNLTATELDFADGSQLRNDFRGAALNPEIPEDHLKATIPADYTVTEPGR